MLQRSVSIGAVARPNRHAQCVVGRVERVDGLARRRIEDEVGEDQPALTLMRSLEETERLLHVLAFDLFHVFGFGEGTSRAHQPFTHITCLSSATTSTKSRWYSMTLSMSL